MDSARRSLGPVLWLTLVLALLAGGAIFLATRDTRRGALGPELGVGRTDDQGAALVYRLYERMGLKPRTWDQDFSHLKEPGLVILLAPAGESDNPFAGSDIDILPFEITALDEWVKQGSVVVVMSRARNSLYQGIGLIPDSPKQSASGPAEPQQPGVLAVGVGKLQTMNPFGFKFGRKQDDMAKAMGIEEPAPPIPAVPEDEWLTLFARKDGQRTVPQVVSAARGKGLYVAVSDAYPAGNLGLPEGDNARFMVNLSRLAPAGGTIWFDEYHKRPVERGVVAYLRERALAPALLYGLLLVFLLFWRTGSRFGSAAPLVPDRRRDSGEYVRAVAALYRNAGMTREALTTVYSDFRKRLSGALRLDGLTDLEEVGRRYEMRTGRPAIEARQALIEVEAALGRPKLDEREALQFCSRLTAIDEALHRRQDGKQGKAARRAG